MSGLACANGSPPLNVTPSSKVFDTIVSNRSDIETYLPPSNECV